MSSTQAMEPLLLDVQNLSVAVSGNGVPVVRDVSFSLKAGEVMAIVGESGSGKTMVARSILNLLPPGLEMTDGEIRFMDRDLRTMSWGKLRRIRGADIGMVFQEPMTSLNPALTIGHQLEEGLRLHTSLTRGERHGRMFEMLERVGIPDPRSCLSAYPHEFSGGMRQRIMLASVMLLRPKLLIADEPTTALDAVVQRDVMDLMVELTREHDTAVLLVSHDLAMVAHYAARVVVMQEGAIVEQGDTKQLLMTPNHLYTRRLLDALPRRQPPRDPVVGDALVDVRELIVDYPGRMRLFRRTPDKRAVDGVTLSIKPGETVAVVGGSGSGKTTLGRAIIGLTKRAEGSILFDGNDPFSGNSAQLRQLRSRMQIVFQDPFSSLDPRMRVSQLVGEPLRHARDLDATAKAKLVEEVLHDVGLRPEHLRRYPHQLSGGQRQRVAIARAIVRRPDIVIADEPVSALDLTVQKQILDLFADLQRRYGFACLFISHDLGAVEQVADRVLVMNNGRIVEEGTCREVFDRPAHPYTRKLLSAMNVLEPMGQGYRLVRREIAQTGTGT